MADDIGNIKSVNGSSVALNCQKGQGAVKTSASGNHNPGDTKPPRAPESPVPIP